jgi:hypothetical protein
MSTADISRPRYRDCLRWAITIVIALGLGSGERAWAAPVQTTPLTEGAVTISRNRILRDSAPWVPHAVQMVAFVAPPSAQTGAFLRAYEHYSPAEFTAIRRWGADSVRIQLSQPGSDPCPDPGDPDAGV